MKRLSAGLLAAVCMFAALLASAPSASAAQAQRDRLDVYTGVIDAGQLKRLVALGVDRHELDVSAVRGAKATVRVEAIMSGRQADALADKGVELAPKEIDGRTVAERAARMAADGTEVFRRYSGAGA